MSLSAFQYALQKNPLGCNKGTCPNDVLASDIEAEKQRWVNSCVEAVKTSDPLFINRNKQSLKCAAVFEEFVYPLRNRKMDKNVQDQQKLEANTGFDSTTLIIIIAAVAVAIYIYKN